MKSFLLTGLGAALIASAAAATPAMARDDHGHQMSRHPVSRAAPQHHFRKGERFDRRQAMNYRELNYRQYKRLKAPPRGYHWVRSGNDAVLVGVASGVVAAVVASMFN